MKQAFTNYSQHLLNWRTHWVAESPHEENIPWMFFFRSPSHNAWNIVHYWPELAI